MLEPHANATADPDRDALLSGLRQAWHLQKMAICDARLAMLEIEDMARALRCGGISPADAMRALGCSPHPHEWFGAPVRIVTTGECLDALRWGGAQALLDLDVDLAMHPGDLARRAA